MHPVLRRCRASLDLEFLQRIWERGGPALVSLWAVVKRAVENIRYTERDASGDGQRRDVGRERIPAGAADSVVGCRRRAAGQNDEIRHIAPVERQLQNTLVLHHGADASTSRLYLRCIGFHHHLLTQSANL